MHLRRLALSAVALVSAFSSGRGEDWPQFRGPGGTGVVAGKVLPPDGWTTKDNVVWKTEIPGRVGRARS